MSGMRDPLCWSVLVAATLCAHACTPMQRSAGTAGKTTTPVAENASTHACPPTCYSPVEDHSRQIVPCDSPRAMSMTRDGEDLDRDASGAWVKHVDPDPTEAITPLRKSAVASIANDPPREDCEIIECPSGSGFPDLAFETIAKAIPELEAGARLAGQERGCGSMTYKLEPRILEPHLVVRRSISCHCSKPAVHCQLEEYREFYESESRESIPLSDTVTVAEALEIASLFRAGKFAGAPKDFAPATLAGIYRNGPNFELYLANCGENALVKLEGKGKGRRLRYLKGVHGSGCV